MSPRPLSLRLYAAAMGALEPFAPAALRRRAGRGKEDHARLPERLGRATLARPPGPLVWLHGVSVGESLSLLPLIEALRRRRPELSLLVTSGTVTAAELLAKRLPLGVIHQYAPVDGPAAVARFLDHWRPGLGVLVESDLWPNLVLGAHARGTRLALLSALMTKASAGRWARSPQAARSLLAAFDLILPQDGDSQARLAALGGRTGPQLNLKLAGGALDCDAAELSRMRTLIGPRRVILAVSTHPGEDALIAGAARAADPEALLIIAPRHPDRGSALAVELAAAGHRTARRAAGQAIAADTGIYIADTLGELGLFLRLADVAVMGGSFVDGIGGHNPLEAARLGVPIVTGRHVFKARAVYDDLLTWAGAVEAADASDLTHHLKGLLSSPTVARRIGEAAQAFAGRQGAAFEAALDLLDPLLPA